MKQYFNSIRKTAWAVSALLMLASCNDWNDHYSYKPQPGTSVKTLAETIQELSGTAEFETAKDDFVLVLQRTNQLNGEKIVEGLSFWNLLEEDQFLTVWIPTTVTAEEWEEYLNPQTNAEKKKVAREFVMNHIARFRHSVNSVTNEAVYMLSDKSFKSLPKSIGSIAYSNYPERQNTNILCSNGIIHILDGKMEYLPSIYDYLTLTSPYTKLRKHPNEMYDYRTVMGDWFAKYTEEKIDEEKSVDAGYDEKTNEIKWADSVLIKSSILMDDFGFIGEEDSNYAVVLPTPALWIQMYDSITQSFEFGPLEADADSLQEFYTNYFMLTDMFFNMNIQKNNGKDSVTSTRFDKNYNLKYKKAYNTYYKPYDAGGLFADRYDSVLCSNGIIYIRDKWPFTDDMLHRRPIVIEAETYSYDGDDIRHPRRLISTFQGKELDNVFVAQLSQKNSSPRWKVEFNIRNNLKGKYRVKFVIFPSETQKNAQTKLTKPNLFHPIVKYMPEKKYDVLIDSIEEIDVAPFVTPALFRNNVNKIDTMDMGVVNFSTCNYDKAEKNSPRITIELSSEVDSAEVYSSEIWLDCIILDPVFD